MKLLLFCFLLFISSFYPVSRGGEPGGTFPAPRKICFKRTLKKGDFFSCFARINRSFEYTLALPGAKNIERKEVLALSLAGILRIQEVNHKGQPEKISLYISSITGSRNGKEIRSRDWKGQELLGDFPRNREFGPQFRAPGLKRELTADERVLFQALFPGGDAGTLADFTSPFLTLREKEKFPLQFTSLLASLAARKITDKKDALSGEGEYLGKTKFRGIECHKLRIYFTANNVPGYDLRYQAELLLPEDPAFGPPLQIYRNTKEFLKRTISSSNQFAAGGRLSQLVSEEASIILMPESAPQLPERDARGKKEGFHQLLQPR